jgi:hypothetical protein
LNKAEWGETMGKGLRGAFDSPMTRKALSLGIMFVFLGVLAGLTSLAGAGSETLFAITSGIGDYQDLIGLGAGIGIAITFMGGSR